MYPLIPPDHPPPRLFIFTQIYSRDDIRLMHLGSVLLSTRGDFTGRLKLPEHYYCITAHRSTLSNTSPPGAPLEFTQVQVPGDPWPVRDSIHPDQRPLMGTHTSTRQISALWMTGPDLYGAGPLVVAAVTGQLCYQAQSGPPGPRAGVYQPGVGSEWGWWEYVKTFPRVLLWKYELKLLYTLQP